MSATHGTRCPHCGASPVDVNVDEGTIALHCPKCGHQETSPYTPASMFKAGHQYRVRLSWQAPTTLRTAAILRQVVPGFADVSAQDLVQQLGHTFSWDISPLWSESEAEATAHRATRLGITAEVIYEARDQ